MSPLLIPVVVLSGIGLVMASLLAIGRKAFAVEVDERQEKLMEILPGANCGGCGYPGCSGYAVALVKGEATPVLCPPGGAELAAEIGEVLGVEVGEIIPKVAVIACAGGEKYAPRRAEYMGVADCLAADRVAGGPKKCTYGCLGLGSCLVACPFDAIVITDDRLAVVIPELCTGCGQCVETCPRSLIRLTPTAEKVHVLCNNPGKSKAIKAVCEIGCTGCKICAKQSPRLVIEGALAHVDLESEGEIPDSARLSCPQGAIFDGRQNSLISWVTDPKVREEHNKQSEKWKEEEKARKQAAKKAKAEKKAKAAAKKAKVEEEGDVKPKEKKEPPADSEPNEEKAAAKKENAASSQREEGGDQ